MDPELIFLILLAIIGSCIKHGKNRKRKADALTRQQEQEIQIQQELEQQQRQASVSPEELQGVMNAQVALEQKLKNAQDASAKTADPRILGTSDVEAIPITTGAGLSSQPSPHPDVQKSALVITTYDDSTITQVPTSSSRLPPTDPEENRLVPTKLHVPSFPSPHQTSTTDISLQNMHQCT